MTSVTIITVAYNSACAIKKLVESLPPGLPMTIVDNGPDDGIRNWAASRGIRVLSEGRNLGFGAACNLGATSAQSEFLFFVNPDAYLDKNTLSELLKAAAQHPEAAAFGPALVDENGIATFKRDSYLLARGLRQPRDPGDEHRIVPVLSGAAMLIRRSAFEKVRGFDPLIFLYFEDDDISIRLASHAGPLLLVPTAMVYHAGGKSSNPSYELSKFKGYHWARSRIYVGRKHGKALPVLSGLLDGVSHLISRHSLYDTDRRKGALGRIKGAFSVLIDSHR